MQTITEPVIVALIKSPSLQRLRWIDQCGYPGPFFPTLRKHTRFEHSLGVFFLLRKYGACIEEQVAGLIHDVSHSAFSHCADYVFGDEETQAEQSYQDNLFASFVQETEIPEILHSYGLSFDRIVDDAHFPLKEKKLPDLCADRIDYCLRTAIAGNDISHSDAQLLLTDLSTDGTRWCFREKTSARKFAELFSTMNRKYYCNFSTATMFHSTGEVLRYAVDRKYLTKQDLYQTDDHVLTILAAHAAQDPELHVRFNRMKGETHFHNNRETHLANILVKSRAVDPLCHHEGTITTLSNIYADWKIRVADESVPQEFCIQEQIGQELTV